MTVALGLTRALERAGIPIVGVSIGRRLHRSTWRVDFHPSATLGQRDAAAQICEQYAIESDAALRAETEAACIDDAKALRAAILTALWGRLGRQPTPAEVAAERSRFLNIYRTL